MLNIDPPLAMLAVLASLLANVRQRMLNGKKTTPAMILGSSARRMQW
jgi:hypothetical protein